MYMFPVWAKKLKKGKEKMALFNKTEEIVPEETIYKTYSDAELKDIARGMHTKYTDKIMREIHAAVENKDTEILQESKDRITAAIKDRLNHPLNDGYTLNEEQIAKVLRFIRSMAWGYDELDPLIQDDTISDIKIYSYDNIRIHVRGNPALPFQHHGSCRIGRDCPEGKGFIHAGGKKLIQIYLQFHDRTGAHADYRTLIIVPFWE